MKHGRINVPLLISIAASSSNQSRQDFLKTFGRLPLYRKNELLLAAALENKPYDNSVVQLYIHKIKIGKTATIGLAELIRFEDGNFRDVVPNVADLYLKQGPDFRLEPYGLSIPQWVARIGTGGKTIDFLKLLDKYGADVKNVPKMLFYAAAFKVDEVIAYLKELGCKS